jgi:hypothetical protein
VIDRETVGRYLVLRRLPKPAILTPGFEWGAEAKPAISTPGPSVGRKRQCEPLAEVILAHLNELQAIAATAELILLPSAQFFHLCFSRSDNVLFDRRNHFFDILVLIRVFDDGPEAPDEIEHAVFMLRLLDQ